jgi:hypothetical protein
VDYHIWLGPAPKRHFNHHRFYYNWRFFWDYGNSDPASRASPQQVALSPCCGSKSLGPDTARGIAHIGRKDALWVWESVYIMPSYSAILPLAAVLAWPGIAAAQSRNAARTVTLPAGTPITVRLDQPLSTEHTPSGAQFTGTLAKPLIKNGQTVLPQGTKAYGTVVESKKSGRLKGHAQMALRLDSIHANGRVYPVATTGQNFAGKSKKSHNLKWIGGGGAGGTIIGAIAGGGTGALIGAGVGAAGGTAGAAATSNRNLTLAAETPLTFTLSHPVTLHERVRASRASR